MEFEDLDTLVLAANNFYTSIIGQLRRTATDIWCLGRILLREKELVGRGNWMIHCKKAHPEISLDSIERYMMIGRIPKDQLPILVDKTLTQAYQMFRPAKKRPALPAHPVESDSLKVDSAQLRKFEQSPWVSNYLQCPYCNGKIELMRKGPFWAAGRAKTAGANPTQLRSS
jgi:DNA-directed RNA polymerase subunit RPC12/RpoP